MYCCNGYFDVVPGMEYVFHIDPTIVYSGAGILQEVGDHAKHRNMSRIGIFTDKNVRNLPFFAKAIESVKKNGIDFEIYDEVKCEPTDKSFMHAIEFATRGKFNGYVSIGGGSVIDTCKAAILYATHPADFFDYIVPPIGNFKLVPGAGAGLGPVPPHIACPTTSGSGAESTSVAVFKLTGRNFKFNIVHPLLRPTMALLDTATSHSLPSQVVASSGFDVLSHAVEGFTARPFTRRDRAPNAAMRPGVQGANPWSDIGCEAALRMVSKYFLRAVKDSSDHEARENMMYAATISGMAFKSAGVHLPHGLSYAIAGSVKSYRSLGYPQEDAMVPHGQAVIVNAPAVFRFTAAACPERHMHVANCLGADTRGASLKDAGEVVANHIIQLMKVTGMPNGISGIGFSEKDLDSLADGASTQERVNSNAPVKIEKSDLRNLFKSALEYW